MFCEPLLDGHEAAQQRVSDPLLTWLRRIGVMVLGNPLDASRDLRATDLASICYASDIVIPGAQSPERAAQTIGSHMAKLFRDQVHDEIEVDGITVQRITRKEADEEYKEVHFYRFCRPAAAHAVHLERTLENGPLF